MMQRLRSTFALTLATSCLLLTPLTNFADDPPDSKTLEQQQESVQQQADQLLRKYHSLLSSNESDPAALDAARKDALDAFTNALRLELQLRAARIEAARERLDAVEQKLELSRKMIDQVASNRLGASLAKLSSGNTTRFATPQAVLDRMNERMQQQDFAGLIELLNEDASRELAGSMLITSAGLSIISQFAAVGGIDDKELKAMQGMEDFLGDAILENPPPRALAAYTHLMQTYVAAMFSQPRPKSYLGDSNPFRTSAGMLKDHRQFIVDASRALESVTGSSIFENSGEPMQWTVTVNGETATAVSNGSSQAVASPSEIELRRSNGEWRISKLISDEMMEKLAAGPTQASPPAAASAQPSNLGFPASPETQSTPLEIDPASVPASPTPAAPMPAAPSTYVPATGVTPYQSSGAVSGAVTLPVYSGQPIAHWLKMYWDTTTNSQPYGNSLNAIDSGDWTCGSIRSILTQRTNWLASMQSRFWEDAAPQPTAHNRS